MAEDENKNLSRLTKLEKKFNVREQKINELFDLIDNLEMKYDQGHGQRIEKLEASSASQTEVLRECFDIVATSLKNLGHLNAGNDIYTSLSKLDGDSKKEIVYCTECGRIINPIHPDEARICWKCILDINTIKNDGDNPMLGDGIPVDARYPATGSTPSNTTTSDEHYFAEKEPPEEMYWCPYCEKTHPINHILVEKADLEKLFKRLEHFLDVNRRGAFPYPSVYVDWDNDLFNDKKKYLKGEA